MKAVLIVVLILSSLGTSSMLNVFLDEECILLGYMDSARGFNIRQKSLRKNGTSLHSPENIFKELRWMELWHIQACFQECDKNWTEE